MNNIRRKRIRMVIKELQGPAPDWDYVESELNDLLSEENEAFENIPENLQDTDRYIIAEESCDYLDEAIGYIDPDDDDCTAYVIETLQQIDGV